MRHQDDPSMEDSFEEPDEEEATPIEEPESEEFDFYAISADSDVDVVSAQIEEKYGFTPSDDYVIDLIAFVREILSGIEQDATDVPS